jgi:hypothetical protein
VPDTFGDLYRQRPDGHENLSISMKLLLFIPAYCDEPSHLGMIRIQSLLAERLRRHLACEIVSAVVVDFCRDDLKTELRRIVAPFDIVRHSAGAPQGIRRPTNHAIDTLLPETGASCMLRVIQDAFIDDPATLSRGIEAAMPEVGHWVAAGVEHVERDGHQGWCEEIGVPFRRELEFPQGALMLAPAETWREMYLQGLPESITHHWDDLMMGELLRHRGGRLIELPRSWTHRRECGAHVARTIYGQHKAQVRFPHRRWTAPAPSVWEKAAADYARPYAGEGGHDVPMVGVRAAPAGGELNAIFQECGSDKAAVHNYGAVYELLLRGFRHRPFTLLKLGAGCGGSLRAWERYCPLAKIIASDINPVARRFAGPRTTVEIVNHHNRRALAVLGKHAPLDFIIDDGDHQPCAVRTVYEVLWPLLRVGGVYVIEDLQVARTPAFHPETGPIFDGVAARLAAENVESGLTDRITIVAGELVAFVKVR